MARTATKSAQWHQRAHTLRRTLDKLGYADPVSESSLPLVERIVQELQSLASKLDESDRMWHEYEQLAAEADSKTLPLRRENARLIREQNQLHLQIIRDGEAFDEREREYKEKAQEVQASHAEALFVASQLRQRNALLERTVRLQQERLIELGAESSGEGAYASESRGATQRESHRTQPKQVRAPRLQMDGTFRGGGGMVPPLSPRSMQVRNNSFDKDNGGRLSSDVKLDDGDSDEVDAEGQREHSAVALGGRDHISMLEERNAKLQEQVTAREREIIRLGRKLEEAALAGSLTQSESRKILQELRDHREYLEAAEVHGKEERQPEKAHLEIPASGSHTETKPHPECHSTEHVYELAVTQKQYDTAQQGTLSVVSQRDGAKSQSSTQHRSTGSQTREQEADAENRKVFTNCTLAQEDLLRTSSEIISLQNEVESLTQAGEELKACVAEQERHIRELSAQIERAVGDRDEALHTVAALREQLQLAEKQNSSLAAQIHDYQPMAKRVEELSVANESLIKDLESCRTLLAVAQDDAHSAQTRLQRALVPSEVTDKHCSTELSEEERGTITHCHYNHDDVVGSDTRDPVSAKEHATASVGQTPAEAEPPRSGATGQRHPKDSSAERDSESNLITESKTSTKFYREHNQPFVRREVSNFDLVGSETSTVTALRASRDTLLDKVASLEVSLEQSQTRNERLAQELEEARDQWSIKCKEVEQLADLARHMEKQAERTAQRIRELAARLTAEEGRTREALERVRDERRKYDELYANHDKTRASLLQLDNDRDVLQGRVEELHQEVSHHHAKVASLEGERQQLLARCERVAQETKSALAEDDAAATREKLRACTEELKAARTEAETTQIECTNLEDDLANMTKENQTLNAELAQVSEKFSKLEGERDAMHTRTAYLEHVIQTKEQEMIDLNEVYQKACIENRNLAAELTTHEARSTRVESETVGVRAELAEVEGILGRSQDANARLQSDLRAVSDHNAKLAEELANAQSEIERCERALAETQRELAAARAAARMSERNADAARRAAAAQESSGGSSRDGELNGREQQLIARESAANQRARTAEHSIRELEDLLRGERARAGRLVEERDDLHRARARQDSELHQLRSKCTTLTQQVVHLSSHTREVELRAERTSGTLGTTEATVRALEQRAREAEDRASALQRKLADLEGERNAISAERSRIKAALYKYEVELGAVERRAATMAEENARLTARLASGSADLVAEKQRGSTLATQASEGKARAAELSAELRRSFENAVRVEQRERSMFAEAETAREERDRESARSEELQTKLHDAEERVELLRASKERAEQTLLEVDAARDRQAAQARQVPQPAQSASTELA